MTSDKAITLKLLKGCIDDAIGREISARTAFAKEADEAFKDHRIEDYDKFKLLGSVECKDGNTCVYGSYEGKPFIGMYVWSDDSNKPLKHPSLAPLLTSEFFDNDMLAKDLEIKSYNSGTGKFDYTFDSSIELIDEVIELLDRHNRVIGFTVNCDTALFLCTCAEVLSKVFIHAPLKIKAN